MSDNCRVIKLENFLNEGSNGLDMQLSATLLYGFKKDTSVNYWLFGGWEQINDNVLKQGQIVSEELGHINISEGS